MAEFGDPRLPERFWNKVIPAEPDECWIWNAAKMGAGYGYIWWVSRLVGAHRVAYQELSMPIPEGWEIDHLCQTPLCVNPVHLEPVTAEENRRRVTERRTRCKRGHAFDEANTHVRKNGKRDCRACHREAERERRCRKSGRKDTRV